MRKLFFGWVLAGLSSASLGLTQGYGQTIWTVQSISASATVSSTATAVIVTGGTGVTVTLPSSPATGRVVKISNHSGSDVTISPAVTVRNGVTSALLSSYSAEILPGISNNRMTVVYDGTVWRLID